MESNTEQTKQKTLLKNYKLLMKMFKRRSDTKGFNQSPCSNNTLNLLMCFSGS